jgi:hypothetical protein
VPPAPLTPTTRYFPPGVRKVYFVSTIANYLAPTRAEINAGTDLTAEIATGGMAGWSLAGSTVDTGDLGSNFTSTVPGRLTSPTNSIDFYLSQNSIDARSLLPRTTNGYIAVLWEGDVPGNKMDVFPVRVITQANDTNTEDPGKTTIEFAITRIPAITITIPA